MLNRHYFLWGNLNNLKLTLLILFSSHVYNSIYFILFTILAVFFFFWYWSLLSFTLCTYIRCLLCNYLWNDSILVLARVGNLVFHIHLVIAFELSYLLSKDVKQCCVLFICFYWKERFSLWMQLGFCMLENIIFCGGWHIETQYWNWVKDELYEQWQSIKPFRRIFLQFLWSLQMLSHFVFSFDPHEENTLTFTKGKSSESLGRCPKVDASSPSFKADEI